MPESQAKLWSRLSKNELLFIDECTLDVPYRSRSEVITRAVVLFLEKVATDEDVPYDTFKKRRDDVTFVRGYDVPTDVHRRLKALCRRRDWRLTTTVRVALAEYARELKRRRQERRQPRSSE